MPQQTRDKMRALDTNIKADFIKQDKSGSGSIFNVDVQSRPASPSKRPFATRRSRTDDGTVACTEEPEVLDCNDSGKVRGRSRTATFTRGDLSPLKKQKQERPASRGRPKSSDLTPSSSSKSLTSVGAVQALSFLAKAPKPAVPDEFISYLRKVQKPESVEIGKLHKLRQLLRNETISWVDAFITRGGMTEVVELLYRIMKVEWR